MPLDPFGRARQILGNYIQRSTEMAGRQFDELSDALFGMSGADVAGNLGQGAFFVGNPENENFVLQALGGLASPVSVPGVSQGRGTLRAAAHKAPDDIEIDKMLREVLNRSREAERRARLRRGDVVDQRTVHRIELDDILREPTRGDILLGRAERGAELAGTMLGTAIPGTAKGAARSFAIHVPMTSVNVLGQSFIDSLEERQHREAPPGQRLARGAF